MTTRTPSHDDTFRQPPQLPDALPRPPARAPEPPPLGDQTFRDEPITRRPRVDQAALARGAAAELGASRLSEDPRVAEAATRLAAAARWREERERAAAWLEYVQAADAFVWERALEALADVREHIDAHRIIDRTLDAELPELRRFFARPGEATRRGLARRRARDEAARAADRQAEHVDRQVEHAERQAARADEHAPSTAAQGEARPPSLADTAASPRPDAAGDAGPSVVPLRGGPAAVPPRAVGSSALVPAATQDVRGAADGAVRGVPLSPPARPRYRGAS